MIRQPPRSTRTDTLFPYTTLFRSQEITANAEEDALTVIANGGDRARRLNQQGQADRIAGSNAASAGKINMASTLLEGAAMTARRSEEHTSELQSLMRNSYAVFCLKKKKQNKLTKTNTQNKNS